MAKQTPMQKWEGSAKDKAEDAKGSKPMAGKCPKCKKPKHAGACKK